MGEYEIFLEWTGKGRRPDMSEYGFFPNPPITLHAKSRKKALLMLKLPKNVKVSKKRKR